MDSKMKKYCTDKWWGKTISECLRIDLIPEEWQILSYSL